jgi:hypothetical protein
MSWKLVGMNATRNPTRPLNATSAPHTFDPSNQYLQWRRISKRIPEIALDIDRRVEVELLQSALRNSNAFDWGRKLPALLDIFLMDFGPAGAAGPVDVVRHDGHKESD